MKRDFKLIRALLLFFEAKPDPKAIKLPAIDGYDERTIKYHLVLLHDAGLLRCEPIRSNTSDRVIDVIPFDLTWDGHEFLEKIRSDKAWKKVIGYIQNSGGVMAFDVINGIATHLARKAVGID
jgi:hypothetical protein